MRLEFSRQIFEKYTTNVVKFRVVGAELFHTDGRIDGRDAFSNFAKTPKEKLRKGVFCLSYYRLLRLLDR